MSFNWTLFEKLPVVGILRGFTLTETQNIVEASIEGGLTSIEVTLNSDEPFHQIETLVKAHKDIINIGAGTVLSIPDVKKAQDAGASFIVTPVTDVELIHYCKENELAVFPGAFSPSEIHQAHSAGADMVKVFPAQALGASYIKAVLGPLDDLKLLPTGGVNLDTVIDFKNAGAKGYGVGSPLFNKEQVNNSNWKWITEQVQKFGELLHD